VTITIHGTGTDIDDSPDTSLARQPAKKCLHAQVMLTGRRWWRTVKNIGITAALARTVFHAGSRSIKINADRTPTGFNQFLRALMTADNAGNVIPAARQQRRHALPDSTATHD
jgi:hypothetical protein